MTTQVVTIEKLVHGGQGIATLADGRRVFVWGVLPNEEVEIELTKSKNKLAQGTVKNIVKPSPDRIAPRDVAYLSTSPWQIMPLATENKHKLTILQETLQREHVKHDGSITMNSVKKEWHYRNKMEYSFWADEAGLHLALFNRGSHGKQIVLGSSIAMPQVDEQAQAILGVLNKNSVRGSQLKTLVIRTNQQGETAAALFVKDDSFPDIPELAASCKGVAVYYSTPKSPASVITLKLFEYGNITLTDKILGQSIIYDVNSFFQVNLETFTQAVKQIQQLIGNEPYVDMYSGVGTIGLSIGGAAILVDYDKHNCVMAKQNAMGTKARVVHAAAEDALDYITNDYQLVVDPPRAGLHGKVTTRILEALPPKIIYLSCNPITQARDLALLQVKYTITFVTGYNFFPRTPHIESLAVLVRK